MAFKPALIVNGSLAVPDARAITAPVNHLLSLPFALKLATRDWHPPNHISFAPNHLSSQPFTSTTTVPHPSDPSRAPYTTTLWPVHCVADSPGAQLVPDLHASLLDAVVDKGRDPRVEMYSAFYDPFRVEDSGLARTLRDAAVTHVYVVGLAADYCVKATAEDAVQEGFETYIVEEGTRPVVVDRWPECREQIVAKGVRMVSVEGEEVKRVERLS
ncbi:NAD(+) salvage pathway protein [Amphichorda felina]